VSDEVVWSWAASPAEVESRVEHARRLIGERLAAVRYFHLDCGRDEVAGDVRGPRQVIDPVEWRDRPWEAMDFHWTDYGVELATASGRVFSVTWDPPGMTEGVGLRELPMAGFGVAKDAGVAVWDVGAQPEWRRLIGAEITDVTMHYTSWDDDRVHGYWCDRITVVVGATTVTLVLGEADADGTLKPAGDSVAILFDSSAQTRPVGG
jgi:hypothetical protein